jgi:hypothetical protein
VARRANITNPLSLSKAEVQARLQGCLHHLFQLKEQASTLRKKHLQWWLSVARDRGDEEATREILSIVKNETSWQ